jgi:hypothetical protein
MFIIVKNPMPEGPRDGKLLCRPAFMHAGRHMHYMAGEPFDNVTHACGR